MENIAAGNVIQGATDHCAAIRNILSAGETAGRTVKTGFESKQLVKEKQADFLEDYAKQNGLWLNIPSFEHYIGGGSEARVYLHHDNRHVLKINDAGYYATWLEYFDSVCLHNILFPNTSYELVHLAKDLAPDGQNRLHAIVQQSYITTDRVVELSEVKAFLEHNGFENVRRNDYIYAELGLILEDMHDENVLVQQDTLFFIDTVFYIDPSLRETE
ncbi:hypothetical protein [Sediminibacterium ginsengisoli]|uniref:Uncharacterized protein n=1 Tax=Sediminibacterium ginsengisoli TaxID=413434 RepID=A0A1T4KCK4_9BACT|nr:hypothetical protein [Sediminibacterium ginsengisoli]SJZ40063.1 hypothetical protein SAMN04488132_101610 [Sediminibacterium ginsengisoli]